MYQKVIVVGNLGRDPEMRYMPDGTAVTNLSVATSRRWTDKTTGQPVEETIWFRVSVFGRMDETANQYLSKGRPVLVEGHLRSDPQTGGPRIWTAQDGTVRANYEITADVVRFIGGREGGGGGTSFEDEPARGTGGGKQAAHEEDDLPF